MSQLFRRENLLAFLLITVLSALVFGLPLYHLVIEHHGLDYNAHIGIARGLLNGQLFLIHLVFHGLVAGLQALPVLNFESAAFLLMILFYSGTVTVLYIWLRPVTSSRVVALIVAFALNFITPITIFTWAEGSFFHSYLGINYMHNPTMVVVKFFAIIGFIYTLRALNGSLQFNARNVIIGVIITVLAMFSKPNFALVLLPALVIILLTRYLRNRDTTGLRLMTFALIVPMIILLPVQYIMQYVFIPASTESQIAFQPFALLMYEESSALVVIGKVLLSILFPLVITLLYRKTAFANQSMILSWLMFLFGMIQFTLFAETGARFEHGNFQWSVQIGLFLLFASSARLLLQEFRREPRGYISGVVFALHMISGIVLLVGLTIAQSEFTLW